MRASTRSAPISFGPNSPLTGRPECGCGIPCIGGKYSLPCTVFRMPAMGEKRQVLVVSAKIFVSVQQNGTFRHHIYESRSGREAGFIDKDVSGDSAGRATGKEIPGRTAVVRWPESAVVPFPNIQLADFGQMKNPCQFPYYRRNGSITSEIEFSFVLSPSCGRAWRRRASGKRVPYRISPAVRWCRRRGSSGCRRAYSSR